jgi:aldehyde dehydrogenase (NAD+)
VSNDFGYGPLIDADAFARFEQAKQQAVREGGRIVLGKRLLEKDYPKADYVEPALALMPEQSAIMHEETFAPLLFIVPYEGDLANAIAMMNAPANAGLVSAIYTLSQKEADQFAAETQAGHGVINSPKGTGTPAFGMGFGGNKASGEGEILNTADPLRAFTRDTHFTRIAQYKEIVMDAG